MLDQVKLSKKWQKPVGGSDDEDVLLGPHSVHFCEDLVDDAVRSTSGIADASSSGLGDRILIKESNGCGVTRFWLNNLTTRG